LKKIAQGYSRNKYCKCLYKQWYGRNGKWNQNNIVKKVGIDIDIEEKKICVVFYVYYGLWFDSNKIKLLSNPCTMQWDEKLLDFCKEYLVDSKT